MTKPICLKKSSLQLKFCEEAGFNFRDLFSENCGLAAAFAAVTLGVLIPRSLKISWSSSGINLVFKPVRFLYLAGFLFI